jgi:hypothetical protein
VTILNIAELLHEWAKFFGNVANVLTVELGSKHLEFKKMKNLCFEGHTATTRVFRL